MSRVIKAKIFETPIQAFQYVSSLHSLNPLPTASAATEGYSKKKILVGIYYTKENVLSNLNIPSTL